MIRVSKAAVFVLALALAGAARAGSDEEPTVTFSRPAERHAGCFVESIRLPAEATLRLPERALVAFTVEESGRIADVVADADGLAILETQLRGALSRCAWTPAADAHGAPMSVRVRMPVRFDLEQRSGELAAVARVEEPSFSPVRLASR